MRNRQSENFQRDLVLVGGGHSHALLLLRWAMSPLPDVRLTLISEQSRSPYSGMLPGLVAGHYREQDVYIDLRRLCRHVGARFICAPVAGVAPERRQVLLADRPPVDYDLLSLNVGATPTLDVPGVAEHAVAVKPIASFWPRWQQIHQHLLASEQARDLVIVGGGAGSVELAMAMAHALREAPVQHRLHILTRGESLLPEYPASLRRSLARRLDKLQIRVRDHFEVVAVSASRVLSRESEQLDCDHLFWCTQAQATPWLGEGGLAVTDQGFVRVTPCLQSVSHDRIFAAGDCAWIDQHPLPRAGVYAVRQARQLFDNLQRQLQGRPLKPYRPQRHFLSLLACGHRDAIGARGRWSIAGSWVWHWKDRIDRQFMRRFQTLPVLPPPKRDSERSLEPPAMRCGGCGAKVGADVLQQALDSLTGEDICRQEARDDAAIIALPGNSGERLVQSVDALKPLLDDPYLFGRLTALHALSDLFAMNAAAHSAQAMVQLPAMAEDLQVRDLRQLLEGVSNELERHGASLLGGHTLEGEGLQLSLTVNGFVASEAVQHKLGAREGDRLILTKALGTGTIYSAAMRGAAEADWVDAALSAMLQSNAGAAAILASHRCRALTDITGFGLAGHLLEMLGKGELGAELNVNAIPAIPGALDCLARGYHSTLTPANERSRHRLQLNGVNAQDPRYQLLFDPQTSGGLLAALPADRAADCLESLRSAGVSAAEIGWVGGDGLRIVGGESEKMINNKQL